MAQEDMERILVRRTLCGLKLILKLLLFSYDLKCFAVAQQKPFKSTSESIFFGLRNWFIVVTKKTVNFEVLSIKHKLGSSIC